MSSAMHEECGVFGIYAPGKDVARMTGFGLQALQHRGQESAGIAVGDGETVNVSKDLGLVTQVFDDDSLNALVGDVAIGHVRYSTSGSKASWEAAQPHMSAMGNPVGKEEEADERHGQDGDRGSGGKEPPRHAFPEGLP